MSSGPRPRASAGVAAGGATRHDPVALEIAWSRLQAVIDEGETTLVRTAFSPIIREAYDFAVVLMDVNGASAGQSQRSLGSFVGTLPRTLRAALRVYPGDTWHVGDVFSTNDPWIGTGHLPDQTMIRPVFRKGRLVAYVGCIAHWADIGGQIWSGDTTEIFEEGLRLPLRKLVDRGALNEDLAAVIAANVRLPEQVMGDLRAQLACLEVCDRRLQELLDDIGLDDPTSFFAQMQDRAERAMRAAIGEIRDGSYAHAVEIDGIDSPLLLQASLTIRGDSIHVDWTGSSPQCERGLNETYNHAYAMTVYPIKCALSPDLPNNEGAYRPISMVAPEGSIINARYPAPVASRQILGHYLSAVVFGALAQVIPDRVLADSGSPSPRVVFSGSWPDGSKYGAALILSGGMGAQAYRDGLTAAPFPSNAGAVSVEMVEAATPLLFRRRALLPDSGGPGRFRGGLGVATYIELRGERNGVVSIMTDRVHHPPLGRAGGGPGRPNVITKNGQPVDPKSRTDWKPGDLLAIESAGGAGFGDVAARDPERIRKDLEQGYISIESAAHDYFLRD
jgi:N-methylhydantoinase B